MPVGLGTAVGYLRLDTTGFAMGVDSAISDMNNLEGKFNTASQGLQTIGGMFSKTGAALTAGFTAPVVGFAAASVKAGTEFDASMSRVAAVSKATGDDLKTIRDRAIEMGEKTRYSATEVSDAMYYMGLAGWDATQIYKGVPGVLALGAASGEDLARVSDIVTDSLTAFGKSADDTTEFVNVLAEASRSSNTTVDMLGESFKYVGPVAGAFGYSIQDTATVLGIFANNGIKSSQAGTGLRQALNALINPSDKAAALMEEYGVSLFNADGSTKSLMTVCEELRGTFGGLAVDIHNADGEVMSGEEIMEKYGHSLPTTEMEKLSAIVKIFGVRALPGMLSVINASDESFYGLAEAINGAQDAYDGLGTAFGMQETMLDNLQGDWYLFTSALGTTKILISDMAKGVLRDLVQRLTELVNKFNEMDPEQREQIVKWALIAASIGPVLIVIGKIISSIGSLITIFSTLKGAFGFVAGGFSNLATGFTTAGTAGAQVTGIMGKLGAAIGGITAPVIAVVAIIAVLVAAFVNLWKNNEEFRNKIIEIWNGIKAKFEEAGQRIVEIFNELGFSFEDFQELMNAAINGLKVLWDGFCEILAPLFTGAFAIIGDTIGGLVDMFVGIIEVIAGVVKGFKDGDWSMLWKGMKDIVESVVFSVTKIIDHFGEAIWNTFKTIEKYLGIDWGVSWEDAKQAIVDFAVLSVKWLNDLITSVINFFSSIGQSISNFFSSVGKFISSIPENIKKLVTIISNSIYEFVTNVVEWFSELPGKLASFFTSIWNNTVDWAKDMVNKAKDVGSNFLNNIVKFFSDLPYNIGYYTGYILGTIVKWVIDMTNKASEMGSKFLDAVVKFFKQLPDKTLEFTTKTLTNIIKWTNDMISKATEVGSKFLKNIVDFFKQLPGKVAEFTTNTWENITKWSTDMINKATDVGSKFLNAIIDFFKQLPVKVSEFITNVWNNVIDWSTNMISKATEVSSSFLNNVVKFFSELPGKILGFLSSVLNNIITWVNDMKQKATEAAKGFFDNVVNGISSLPSKVYSIGSDIVKGIWNGISSAESWIRDKITGFADGLVQGAKDALGIKSPSRVFRDQVGKWIPPGIADGFVKSMPAAKDRIKSILNDTIKDIDKSVKKTTNKTVTKYSGEVGKNLADKLAESIAKQNAKNKKTGAEAAQVLVDAAKEKWDRYSKTHDTTLAEETAFWKEIVSQCKKGSDAYYEALEKYKSANEQLKSSVKSLKESYKKEWGEIKNNLVNDIQKIMDEYENKLLSKTESIKSQVGSLFSGYTFEETEDTTKDLINNLKSQVEALEEWDAQIGGITGKIFSFMPDESDDFVKEFIGELESLGIGATKQLEVLNSMTEKEFKQYIKLWKKRNSQAKYMAKDSLYYDEEEYRRQIEKLIEDANKELNELEKTYNDSLAALGATVSDQSKEIGENIVKGIKSGIKGYKGDLYNDVKDLCDDIVSTAKNALEIKSPSRVFRDQVGKWIPPGIADGFVKSMPSAINEIEDSLNNGINNIETNDIGVKNTNIELQVSDFINLYKQVFESLVIWFEDMEERMVTAVNGLTEQFKYLLYIKQTISNDDFKALVLNGNKSNSFNNKDKTIDLGSLTNRSESNGDTFIFYSPKAIDEVQAAKMLRNTKRDLAEGF